MPDETIRNRALTSRLQPSWTMVCIVLVIALIVGSLGAKLISSGRPGSLSITSGDIAFDLVLPDAEEEMDIETIFAEAIPNPTDEMSDEQKRAVEIRRASTLAILQQGYHLYEFGGTGVKPIPS